MQSKNAAYSMFYITENQNAKKHLLNLIFEPPPFKAGIPIIILSCQLNQKADLPVDFTILPSSEMASCVRGLHMI